jgi:hypothetical protein
MTLRVVDTIAELRVDSPADVIVPVEASDVAVKVPVFVVPSVVVPVTPSVVGMFTALRVAVPDVLSAVDA